MTINKKVRKLLKNNVSYIVFIFALVFFRSAVADWNHVPSGSMEPTLYDGDWLIVNKTEYGASIPFLNVRLFDIGSPARGDVVTFVPPHTDKLYVKRVIGIPGDEIGFSERQITINGNQLNSTRVVSQQLVEIRVESLEGASHRIQYGENGNLPSINGTFIVPENKYFVMGDHRNNSSDSRYWGFVEGNHIMGKVTHVAFSTSDKRSSDRFAIDVE
ncbi:signal peptidase I [Vibrio kagoshimensis]|uniref:signal peptidase I n=1 Tax=Vibrio kagoshimensis TaxID=2910244 RepID=UPI003D22F6E6